MSKTIRKWLVLAGLVVTTAIAGAVAIQADGAWGPPVDHGSWMPTEVTTPIDAYFNRNGAPWVQVHQHFKWDDAHMNEFKSKNADFQWEVNRLGHEYWDYWHCFGPNIYWTNLPDHTDMWAEEEDPPWCFLDKSGDEEWEVKSKDPDALQANFEYGVWVEFSRDQEDLGKALPYQTEAEWCGKPWPFCNWGQDFGWGVLSEGEFANP